MIKIEPNDIDNIVSQYKVALNNWLCLGEKYKNGKWKDKLKNKIKRKKNHYQKMLSFVEKNLVDLVVAKPDEFKRYIDDFSIEFGIDLQQYESAKKKAKSNTAFGKFKATMESFYVNFFDDDSKLAGYLNFKNGIWLATKLDIKVCPYCNRQYTFTINAEGTSTRPQFDHFYPKSEYPYLALSFYNLIPSCPTCNHLKKEKKIKYNPYTKGFGDEYKFRLKSKNGKEVIDWTLEKNNINLTFSNINENIDILGLTHLYEGHMDYIEEIIDKSQAYNNSYYLSLITSYKGLGKQPGEIDRFIWGTYLEEAEHGKRPLSKLTRDLLEQLKIK